MAKTGRPKRVGDMNESLTLRLSEQLKTDLRGLADADARSLSQYVQRALQAHVATAKSKRGKR